MSLSRVSKVARGPNPELVTVIELGSTAAIEGGKTLPSSSAVSTRTPR